MIKYPNTLHKLLYCTLIPVCNKVLYCTLIPVCNKVLYCTLILVCNKVLYCTLIPVCNIQMYYLYYILSLDYFILTEIVILFS